MARNRTVVSASPEAVFSVLADPRRYGYFVVGNKTVRRFDPRWPEPGSKLHHSLGLGLPLIRDNTVSKEIDEPHRLVLQARMRPLAVVETVFLVRPHEKGSLVEVEERAVSGPASAKAVAPLFDGVLWLRNQEVVRRLRKTAERREKQRTRVRA